MIFDHSENEHETIVFGQDKASGLRAIIAIHSRARGPAIGGCRMRAYPDDHSALTDVLRLSKGMSYKCAIGDIPFGGGKAVILGDPNVLKSRELLLAMGDFVDQLGGRYITSFDSGTSLEDIQVIGERTAHIGGIAPGAGNASASTALSVFTCMEESVRLHLSAETMAGLTVAIQGAGNVGARLASMLDAAGARVLLSDIDEVRLERAVAGSEVIPVSPEKILHTECDVLAPCAFGAVITPDLVHHLRCSVVCGGANNQLANERIADALASDKIFYCPDFLANAGGIIDLHYQLNEPSRDPLPDHIDGLRETLRSCYRITQSENLNMLQAANRIAESRFR
ncbi:MAG: Glu/Leu/Phe/Val dehydrogenase dimerization domain-containing protein [Pseudomonadota bacterium]